MIFVRSISTASSVLGLLFLAGCAANSVIERSQAYASVGDYKHAYEEISAEYDRQMASGPIDEEVASVYAAIQLDYLRDRAQMLIFTEREDDALEVLDRLDSIEMNYPGAQELRAAATLKKAGRIVAEAHEKLNRKEFVGAMEGFLASQELIPGFAPAQEGIASVRVELERMSARAQQQFLQAVRKVPEFRHVEVAWHAAAVIHNTPDATDEQRHNAEEIGKHAKRESAQLKFEEGRACEADNQFGAALLLYKVALLFDPELSAAEVAIAEMEIELRALGLLEKAQVAMRTKDFPGANDLLKQAYEMSKLSRAEISDLMMQVSQLKAESLYQDARDLEVMGKKAEALEGFQELVTLFPTGVDDEAARIIGLKVDVESAQSELALAQSAEEAGELQAALDHYLTAARFYAEWQDWAVDIARVRAAIAAKDAEAIEPVESEESVELEESVGTAEPGGTGQIQR